MTNPTTIKTHEEDEPATSVGEFCGICRRQISRYTCPSCNLFYCSLNCFRSERHSQCSETFYRKEIEVGIKSGSSKSEEERNKMLELLRRIEEESAEDESNFYQASDEENEGDHLVHRFSAIDISSASSDDLLRLLNKKEKDKFFAALKDPSSTLTQGLLESAELEKTRKLPWWEAPGKSPHSSRIPCSVKPDVMVVPAHLINQAYRGASLLYNICVVFLAYTYVTRHLSMSPLSSALNDHQDRHEARRILLKYAPFLGDSRSKILHVSLSDAVISFWSRLDPGNVDEKAMVVLLEDVAQLVRPRRIVATGQLSSGEKEMCIPSADHPSSAAIMVISDLSSLFSSHTQSPVPTDHRGHHIVMKLTFYAAHILSTSSSHLHCLANEALLLSKNLGAGVNQL